MRLGDFVLMGLAFIGTYNIVKRLMQSNPSKPEEIKQSVNLVTAEVTPVYPYEQNSIDINSDEFDVTNWVQS